MYLDFNTHCGIKNYLLIRFFVYILSAYIGLHYLFPSTLTACPNNFGYLIN